MGKEAKTNAMRILEREKVPYTCHGNALFMSVLVGGVGHLFTFQNAHGIGFCFFSHL